MASKKKGIRERLEQIKARAAQEQMNMKTRSNAVTMTDLAEEAAGLGLELADLLDGKGT